MERPTRNGARVDLESESDDPFRITAMDVLTESSQIDGVTAEPGPRHVTGPRVDGMVSQYATACSTLDLPALLAP